MWDGAWKLGDLLAGYLCLFGLVSLFVFKINLFIGCVGSLLLRAGFL